MRIDPLLALLVLAAVNLVAFFAQGLDKWRARRSATRTPERTLLVLGLPLAAAGMWLGMRVFRHKTSKPSFLIGAWLITLFNLALAWALYLAWERDWFDIDALGSR